MAKPRIDNHSITWTTERRKVRELLPWEGNPRTIGPRERKELERSLVKFGYVEICVINADNGLLAGHQRCAALIALGRGDEEIEVRVPSRQLTHQEAVEYNLRSNKNVGAWDWEALAKIEREIVLDVGFSEEELKQWTTEPEPAGNPDADAEPQNDRAAELAQKWGVETGQIWRLGEHRLMCGDSTDTDCVSLVMAGDSADLCFTSPPYGQQREYNESASASLSDWDGLMRGVFGAARMSPTGQVLVNLGMVHRDGEWLPYWDGWIGWMREQGWRRFGWYVWDQGWGLPGDWNGRLGPSHEFIFHFNKQSVEPIKHVDSKMAGQSTKGKKGLRGKDGVVSDFCHASGPDASYTYPDSKIPDSVVRVNRQCGSVDHPAPFSVGFAEFMVRSWAGIVYEPFSGSGTTIIACERLGRKCRAIEIDPGYVAVAIQRWVDATGGTPELIDG